MTRRRGALEGLARHAVAWVFCAVYLPSLALACLLTPGTPRQRVWPAMARFWGRAMMHIAGVGLQIDAPAQAALAERRPRVLLFNHSSTLDVFIGAALLPAGGVLVVKKEFIWLPIMGQAAWVVGSVFVDRRKGERARASLVRAAERIEQEQLQILIAPEGTRMKDRELGHFKLGAFHMAQAADAPLLPLVLHGAQRLWPYGALAPQGGTVRVTALAEVSVRGADHARLRVIADEVRASYHTELAGGMLSSPR